MQILELTTTRETKFTYTSNFLMFDLLSVTSTCFIKVIKEKQTDNHCNNKSKIVKNQAF